MLKVKCQVVCFQTDLNMEFVLPTIALKGPVWHSLFCPGEFAELVDWVHQARSPMLGMGFVLEVNGDPRFLRMLEILTGTPDVGIATFLLSS